MNRIGKFVMGLLVAVVMMPCLAREPLTLEGLAKASKAEAATPEGKAYLKEFFTNPWMLAFDAAEEQCNDAQLRSGPFEEFELGLIIGANGYPMEALVSPDKEALTCIADRLKATGFLKPPHDDFAIYMHFKQVEPGTEGKSDSTATAQPAGR